MVDIVFPANQHDDVITSTNSDNDQYISSSVTSQDNSNAYDVQDSEE
jgi:hypothetical protein